MENKVLVKCRKKATTDEKGNAIIHCAGYNCNEEYKLDYSPFDCSMFYVDWTIYIIKKEFLELVEERKWESLQILKG